MSTDDLLEIWKTNDRQLYAAPVFETVSKILIERRIRLPAQVTTSCNEITDEQVIEYCNITRNKMKNDLRNWGIGLLVIGLLQIIISGIFSAI